MTTLSLILGGLTSTGGKPAPLGGKVSLWRQVKSLFTNEPAPGSYQAMVKAMAPRK